MFSLFIILLQAYCYLWEPLQVFKTVGDATKDKNRHELLSMNIQLFRHNLIIIVIKRMFCDGYELEWGPFDYLSRMLMCISCIFLAHWCFSSLFPPVPIIPSYLYNLDESADVEMRNNSLLPQVPSGSFHTIVSLYDNSVRLSGSNSSVSTADLAPPTPAAVRLPQNSSDCPQSNSKLLNENVKVGLLFASKATVQLLTNPFIGPLTNR